MSIQSDLQALYEIRSRYLAELNTPGGPEYSRHEYEEAVLAKLQQVQSLIVQLEQQLANDLNQSPEAISIGYT